MTVASDPTADASQRVFVLRRWARGLFVLAAVWFCAWLVIPPGGERSSRVGMANAAGQRGIQAHLQQARQVLQGVMPDAAPPTTADPMMWLQDAALFFPIGMALTRVMPDVRFVYFSSSTGANHGVENTSDGFRYGGREHSSPDPLVYSSYRAGASSEALTQPPVAGSAEGSDLPVWYAAAAESPKSVWRPAAWSTTQSQLVVTLAQSVQDKSGVLTGVLAADLGLGALNDVLQQTLVEGLGSVQSSQGAFAYLTDGAGTLLASSSGERVVTSDGNGSLSRLIASRSANSGIAASAAALSALPPIAAGAAALPLVPESLKLAGVQYLVSRVNIRDAAAAGNRSDPNWQLVVLVPNNGALSDWPVWLPAVLAVMALTSLGIAALLWQLASTAHRNSRKARVPGGDTAGDADAESDMATKSELPGSGRAVTLVQAISSSVEQESAAALRAELALRSEQLAVMTDRALSSARSRAAFLSVISHEFRTPLNGAVGMSALLGDTALDSEQRSFLTALTTSNEQLQSTLDEIIDYCCAESDDAPWTASLQPVRKLVVESCALASSEAAAKGLVFTVDAPAFVFDAAGTPIAWTVATEPDRLGRIVTILTLNAVKFTERGSVHVVVAMRQSDHGEAGASLELQVIDTGPGIDTAHHSLIFKPFTQVDSSINRSHGGVGLGLAICKRLVAQLGGTLMVGGKVGEGAVFTVCLPALPFPLQAATSTGALRTPQKSPHSVLLGTNHQRVLVVDDNLINLKVASAMLHKFGYIVHTAGSGQEAVDAVCRTMTQGQQGNFQAVLMDIHMPGMDGIAATEAIRAQYQDLAPPIIALTADISGQHVQRCFEAGMVDYLTKPLQSEALRQALARWIVPTSPAAAMAVMSSQEGLREPDHPQFANRPDPVATDTDTDADVNIDADTDEDLNNETYPGLPTGLVDADRLNDFRQFDDSEFTITREVVNLLFKEVPIKLAAIEQAIETQDVVALIAAAHSLRGVSGHVGAVVVQHLCAVMERSATELGAVSPDARAGLIALRSAWKRTRPLLEDVR